MRPSGMQYIQHLTLENGDKLAKRLGIDINIDPRHVQKEGFHLNLETIYNGKTLNNYVNKDPHIPIKLDD